MARSAPGVDAVSGLGFPLWEIAFVGIFRVARLRGGGRTVTPG